MKQLSTVPREQSKKNYRYKGTKKEDIDNKYWDKLENIRDQKRTVSFIVNSKNSELKSLLDQIESRKTRKALTGYLLNLCTYIPKHQIFNEMSTRPNDMTEIEQENRKKFEQLIMELRA